MVDVSERVAVRVRRLRTGKGWSQEQFAEAAGLSRDAVSRIERGDREPRLATLAVMAHALGVSLGTLLDFDRQVSSSPARTMTQRLTRLEHHLGQVGEEFAEHVVRAVAILCQGYLRERTKEGAGLLAAGEGATPYSASRGKASRRSKP